jgi:hypothetical protein
MTRRCEEKDLYGVSGSNVRVRVLADDGKTAKVIVEDCGVVARQGEIREVRSSALNGGRQ